MVKCDETKLWSRYGTSTVYYGRCVSQPDGSDTKIDIYKCSSGTTFDGNTCNLSCSRAANITDTNFPERYFECYKTASGYSYNVTICEGDTLFNPKTNSCEDAPTTN